MAPCPSLNLRPVFCLEEPILRRWSWDSFLEPVPLPHSFPKFSFHSCSFAIFLCTSVFIESSRLIAPSSICTFTFLLPSELWPRQTWLAVSTTCSRISVLNDPSLSMTSKSPWEEYATTCIEEANCTSFIEGSIVNLPEASIAISVDVTITESGIDEERRARTAVCKSAGKICMFWVYWVRG